MMKMLFRQKALAMLDCYDVFDESGDIIYKVKGKLSIGHKLVIYDARGTEVGTVKEVPISLRPQFELYLGREKIGRIRKKYSLLRNDYSIDCFGWRVDGSILGWNYRILDRSGRVIAIVSKVHWRLTDTYSIEVDDQGNAVPVLMFTLAIDAEKCTEAQVLSQISASE